MTFFKPHEWLSLLRKPRKSANQWEAECLRLLTTEATDEDRDKAEELARAWLARVAAGC